VYYRWHPLYGQTLTVWRRTRGRHGERIFCQLPDDTICALPAWMFDPATTEWSLGPPVIAAEALAVLRDLLHALGDANAVGQPSSLGSPREEVDEATDTEIASDHPTESPAAASAHVGAIDSTGFGTQSFYRHFSAKYGHDQYSRDYLKLHAVVGAKTNVIVAASVTDRDTHDSPTLPALATTTAQHFDVAAAS
jgi:hypothetical protein